MEKYREFKTMMGTLDFDMYSNWLKYSNVLIQVCADTQVCGVPEAATTNRPDADTQQRENKSGAAGKIGKEPGSFF